MAQCKVISNDKILICATADELWLLNNESELVELGVGELFGFGTGAYSAKPAGGVGGGRQGEVAVFAQHCRTIDIKCGFMVFHCVKCFHSGFALTRRRAVRI